MNILPLQCFSPTAQQLYLRVLVSLHLAVGLSVSPETLFHILLCSSLLVLQLLLQLVDPETTTQDNRWRYTLSWISWRTLRKAPSSRPPVPVHQLSVVLLQPGFDVAVQQYLILQLRYFLLQKTHLMETKRKTHRKKITIYTVPSELSCVTIQLH